MSERERRLKSLEPLARRFSSARSYSQVKAAEERLGDVKEHILACIEALRAGQPMPEPIQYPGRESDEEIVRRYYAQWPTSGDPKAEMLQQIAKIRSRRQENADLLRAATSD